MKILAFYSPYQPNDMPDIQRIIDQGYHVEVVNIFEAPEMLKKLIRATPHFVPILDHQGGEFLAQGGVDAHTYIDATLAKLMADEEKILHDVNYPRLDTYVAGEKTKAVDDYTLSLVTTGVIV